MFLLVLLTASAFVSVSAYKNGAPTFLCAGTFNRPVHETNLPNNKPAPYKFVMNATGVYRPSEPISITLHGNGVSFKGFFVTADTTTGMFDGSVLNTTMGEKAVPSCGMTHVDNSTKMAITLVWTPPKRAHVGNIQFVATVVYNFTLYWSNVRSDYLEPDMTQYRDLDVVMQEMAAEQQKLILAQQKLIREQQVKMVKDGAQNAQGANKGQNSQIYYDPYYPYYNPTVVGAQQGATPQSVGSRDNQGQGRQG
ncbi:putative ferric-chelate reductase 1 [Gigantopelta aegis]|uniref:putative ferric-chelate reductase 1 n=1 Tax=Gigantopelta aegis TaxID=1735272 RepID=UPI001B88A60F|nr:putative ferric-chelate reductase 1 [Gigantopelta aegis]